MFVWRPLGKHVLCPPSRQNTINKKGGVGSADTGVLAINPIIYAEISIGFERIEDLEAAPGATGCSSASVRAVSTSSDAVLPNSRAPLRVDYANDGNASLCSDKKYSDPTISGFFMISTGCGFVP